MCPNSTESSMNNYNLLLNERPEGQCFVQQINRQTGVPIQGEWSARLSPRSCSQVADGADASRWKCTENENAERPQYICSPVNQN